MNYREVSTERLLPVLVHMAPRTVPYRHCHPYGMILEISQLSHRECKQLSQAGMAETEYEPKQDGKHPFLLHDLQRNLDAMN